MQVVIVLQQESGAGEPGQGWHSLQTIVGERQDVELRKGFKKKNPIKTPFFGGVDN